MRPVHGEGGCWPTASQELLLKASLLTGARALAAWQSWKASVDIEQLDPGSYRMVPLLYRNLHDLGVRDPLMQRFKGIYRKTWYQNQLLVGGLLRILEVFRSAEIEVMTLKGIALILHHYKEVGLRPMADIDLLVRPADTKRAIEVLAGLGYCPTDRPIDGFGDAFIASVNAYNFAIADGPHVDLHWHVFLDNLAPDADGPFWVGREQIRVQGVEVGVMSPTDLLFHVCVHGASWNITPPFRWVADAVTILRNSPSGIDWDRLTWHAARLQLVLPLKQTLGYLEGLLETELPEQAVRKLARTRVSITERVGRRVKTQSAASLGPLEPLWSYYIRHFRPRIEQGGIWHALRTFPAFLQSNWQLDHLWEIPHQGVLRAARRVLARRR